MIKFKKLSAFILTGMLTISLTGCLGGGNDPIPGVDLSNPDPKIDDTQAVTDVTVPDGNDDTSNTSGDVTTEPDETTAEPEENIAKVQSGEAVSYKGKILFREYHPFQFNNNAVFGNFSRSAFSYSSKGNLCSFDPKNPENGATELCEDEGYGDFYLIDGKDLYSQKAVEGEDYSRVYTSVYKTDLNTMESEDICSGSILGFSPDGTHFCAYDYSLNPYLQHYYIYDTADTSKEAAQFVSDDNVVFLGMDNENIYVLNESDSSDSYYVTQIGFDGLEYCLVECDFQSVTEEYAPSYPEFYGDITFNEDSFTFSVSFYEGTGHFYYSSVDVTVPIAKDIKPSSTPIFETRMVDSTKSEEGEDPNNQLPDSIAKFEQYPEYESARGFAKVIQYYNTFDDGTFFAIADCHRDPMEDIGWRENYYLLNIEYCFVPASEREYTVIDTMFDQLGAKGNLSNYEYDEVMNTMYVFAGFFEDANHNLEGIYYEPVMISGPEGPIEESYFTYVTEFAEEFYFESPLEDNVLDDENFVVSGLDEFSKYIYELEPEYRPVKNSEYDYEGYLVLGNQDYNFEDQPVYICQIGFDSEGHVSYIRPVIFE